MLREGDTRCPYCGGTEFRKYGTATKVIRLGGGVSERIKVRRIQCKSCMRVHHFFSGQFLPYKQYSKEIIDGVLDGTISNDILEYEDYPCEMTIKRWKNER